METPPPADTNAAWASVEFAFAAAAVERLLDDPVLLLRLNPCLEFETLERLPGGSLRFSANNESNGCRSASEAQVLRSAGRLVLRYATGIKRETRFEVEPAGRGSRLTLTEAYDAVPEGAGTAPVEVDRSLLPWTAALRRHIQRGARYGRIPGYRWLAERFWPSMPPRHRRIAWLIVWTTAAEFVVFLAALAIYLAARA